MKCGIYLGLNEDEYHADTALGSSDMRKLSYSPPDYWFSSSLNPLKEKDQPTPSQAYGRAVHKIVLEGAQKFNACYGPVDEAASTKEGKREREELNKIGKLPLKRDDWNRILMAAQSIEGNPYLSDAFSGGLPEVSIFWEADGIRKKARFDYLKTRAIVDLKSIRNSRSIDFVAACRRAIADWNYPVQAQHYNEGRMAMKALFNEGSIFGDIPNSDLLERIANSEEWAFVFCFWQAESAPLTWGTVLSPANPILEIGRSYITRAEHNYKKYMHTHGADTPWLIAEPLDEMDISELPTWYGMN